MPRIHAKLAVHKGLPTDTAPGQHNSDLLSSCYWQQLGIDIFIYMSPQVFEGKGEELLKKIKNGMKYSSAGLPSTRSTS
jgi:hypothetical protein